MALMGFRSDDTDKLFSSWLWYVINEIGGATCFSTNPVYIVSFKLSVLSLQRGALYITHTQVTVIYRSGELQWITWHGINYKKSITTAVKVDNR